MGNLFARKNSKKLLNANRPQIFDFDFNVILSELKKYEQFQTDPFKFDNQLDRSNIMKSLVNFNLIEKELNKLSPSFFNFNEYSLRVSNRFLVDVLCSTCFNKAQQLLLVECYIDYRKSIELSKGSNTGTQLNSDDFFLSCLEANSVKVSKLILDEFLITSKTYSREELFKIVNRIEKVKGNESNETTALDIVIYRFRINIDPIIYGIVTFKPDDFIDLIREYEEFILRMFNIGFRINNLTINSGRFLTLLLLSANINTVLVQKEKLDKLNEILNASIKSLALFLIQTSSISKEKLFYRDKRRDLVQELREGFYYKVKKSAIILSPDTQVVLKALIDTSVCKYQPLSLIDTCRRAFKMSHNQNGEKFNRLPRSIVQFLNCEGELAKTIFEFYILLL